MELAYRLVSTRRGSVFVAAAAAALAGVLILVYVDRYRKSVKAEGAPVTVLVARQAIAKGTSGDVIATKALYTATTIREGQLLDGAISDPSSLRGKVAAHDIVPGSQLTAADFARGSSSLAGSLTDTQRVISIPLDTAHGLIGQISAGDRVDVYGGFNVIPLNPDGTPVAGGQSRPVLKLLMSDVPVVSVGGKNGALGSSTTDVDLKVSETGAAQLAFASDNGKIWLALRPAAGAKSTQPPFVSLETLLLGVPPVRVVRSLDGGRR
jgi:Flp pilus assembly protein CpaB